MSEENKAILRRAIEDFNNQNDRAGYFDLYNANCVLHGFAPHPIDLDGAKEFYQGLWAAFSDGKITLDDVIAEGDKVVARYTFDATHTGDFMGIPPTGKQITMQGMTVLRFTTGKCVERWNNANVLGLLQQVGAIPE